MTSVARLMKDLVDLYLLIDSSLPTPFVGSDMNLYTMHEVEPSMNKSAECDTIKVYLHLRT